MKAEIRDRWAEALESDRFRQGTGLLHQINARGVPDTFCCLGVLCELAVEEGIVDRKKAGPMAECYAYGKDYDRSTTTLPQAVVDWAGLRTGNPLIDGLTPAVHLNDSKQWTFKEIAHALRSTPVEMIL
jgi:hypothetical protein